MEASLEKAPSPSLPMPTRTNLMLATSAQQIYQAEQAMQRSGADQRMQALARQQAALATEQADLSSQQAAASVRADKEAQRIMREAIAQGLATQIEG